MEHSRFTFDERSELVRRVLATENIWEVRENVTIPREAEEPPVSPIDIELNIKKWTESQPFNRTPRSPDVHQHNKKFNSKPNDKENSATKLDRRRSNFKSIECGFCRNNGESPLKYSGHRLKNEHGGVVCPVLRSVICPICRDTGENAHTIKFCPKDKKIIFQDGFRSINSL